MLMQILTHTPKWVFALFFALVWLGGKQMLPRNVGVGRATVLPLVMTGLSLLGVTSAFGDSPQALMAWLAGVMLVGIASMQLLPADRARFDAHRSTFHIPGSAVPLALFMGIFFTKYAVGASIGMQPSLAHDSVFAAAVGALYGSFSGIFLARSANLWRLLFAQTASIA